MICPKCRSKFAWHVMVCPTCDVDTVDSLPATDESRPAHEPTPDVELVPVLATGDSAVIAVAQSLLEGEKIEYILRGDGLQDLFGMGRLTAFNFAMGPAEFWVRADDAERARVLLQELTDQEDEEPPPESA